MSPHYEPGDHEIETASGLYVDLADPAPATIRLEDIAQGLANTCRYAGQTRRFYSVGEHAILVANKLAVDGASPFVQLAGLHHDDAEAYIADIARPLKTLLQPAYGEITSNIETAIQIALGVPMKLRGEVAAQVKAADDWALAAEAHHLMPSQGRGWWCEDLYDPDAQPAPTPPRGYRPEDVYVEWLYAHRRLTAAAEGQSELTVTDAAA